MLVLSQDYIGVICNQVIHGYFTKGCTWGSRGGKTLQYLSRYKYQPIWN